jgi:L-lactate dehydrogenase complex protein LldG
MSLPWDTAPGVVRQSGAAEPGDRAALSHAEAGVAETGTLVLLSGSGNPTSLAFLSETHIVVIAEQTIVGCYEDAFDMVRSQLGGAPLPRALNLVGGASRTGDIGGRIVMGAHGPRRLAVIIYPSDAPARWSSDGRGPSAGRGTPGDSA